MWLPTSALFHTALAGCVVTHTRVVSEFDHCMGHVAIPHIIMQGNIYHDNISHRAINIT